ncbi:putative N-acylethanolamine amidohydrolase [Aspergillus japonicus CBS 114.51]|uniref:Putative N-acylethanolamine amidohydrolase n=1 Tax=Aspergillus japonicus CBS 114.51 TaxID=1448312 RepID=A0A8T8WJ49_ASPJA|nr:putative N-acylethanolamine amidohydrolase [Aspergillus japonicus CBS 114.51]RAH75828.1 putative N-acylethanolamine amidohydrolase [Aspergillus japonicus CBS 114.51]
MSAKPQFLQYPEVREGPSVPYKNEDQVIPVFRGMPLAIGASLIQHVGVIQNYFWRNAGFNVIRDLPLDDYAPRYDPTVIPVLDRATPSSASTTTTAATLPAPTQKRKDHPGYYTSADYVALYQSGKLTPSAVVEALLPLIQRDADPAGEPKDGSRKHQHSVAFLESQAERVRAAAAASTQRYRAGRPLGPMDGVPVAVKDEVHLEGYRRTLGSKIDFKGKYQGTSWCAKQWEEAGAIIIGKTSMHELGLDTNNNNPNYGTPRNPHNPDYYCGGSSGGSGYAVSAGLVPIALGADGGGSIRIPSSFCGIWGLKATHGRISGAPTVSLAPTVGVYGPMASSLDDLALAYRIMATPAPAAQDPTSSAFPPPLSTLPPPTLPPTLPSPPSTTPAQTPRTIGLIPAWLDRAHPTVRTVFNQALAHLTTSQKTKDLEIPYLPEGQRAHVLTIMAEIASGLHPAQISQLTAPNKVLVSMGMYQITGQDFLAAQRLRHCLMAHLAHLFRQHPGLIICSPTTPIPGWRIHGPADLTRGLSDGAASVRNMEYVWLANFTGCPAISCPVGWVDAEGGGGKVPVGLMAMAEWGKEEELIAFARELEGALEAAADGEGQGGIQVPSGEGALWEDIIELAKKACSD